MKTSPPPSHTLYGLGVGPGDPELITVKALKTLQTSPVIAFPAGLNGKKGVAERIIEPWLRPEQLRLPLTFPYVLDEQQLSAAWQTAAEAVIPYLQSGNVAFACEGDVSFYGTFTYLAQAIQKLDKTVNVRAIAGVSSPMAAAAAAHIPLTCQSDKLAILPALYSFDDYSFDDSPNALETALRWADVIVLMKVGSVYAQVWEILQQHGLLERSAVIENATRAEERVFVGLQNYPKLQLPYFSLLIVQRANRTIL
ncbi:MAG: precorrin-2 C(20)-methyltransferase [Phormidesmis sp.]